MTTPAERTERNERIDLRDSAIADICRSYGVEVPTRGSGSYESIIEYVTAVLAENTIPDPAAERAQRHLPDDQRRARLAAAVTWSILSRLGLRELLNAERNDQFEAGFRKGLEAIQCELDDLATSIDDYKIPGDGARGYTRGLRHAAQRARETRP